MEANSPKSGFQPPPLEVMASLSSLLVHELANQLSIISGNAQVAQLLAHDPAKVQGALQALLQAADAAGDLIKRCGDLRRSLPNGFVVGDLSALRSLVTTQVNSPAGWSIELDEIGEGSVPLPAHWVAVAIEQAVIEFGTPGGRIAGRTLDYAQTGRRARTAAGNASSRLLEVSVTSAGGREFPFGQIKATRSNLFFLAAYELILNAGGWFDFTPPGSVPSVARILIPLVG